MRRWAGRMCAVVVAVLTGGMVAAADEAPCRLYLAAPAWRLGKTE